MKNGNMNRIIEDTFIATNYKLCNETQIDTNFSGSTCVTLIYTPEKLLCANVGDSRAVLGRCVNGCWVSHDLSRDHKPSDKDESERIIKRRGRIEPFRDEDDQFIGPARVWLKEDDIPGLAMSRSFGDQVAASVGVIAEPGKKDLTVEIKEWKFSKEDMFFIIASDGVWEFIESEEVLYKCKCSVWS
jgi:serine/threonine protein phosphatase PrpC